MSDEDTQELLRTFVDRRRLDFDFEKVCAVSLAQDHLYVCLTCGRFLQGRTPNTPAHVHSLAEEHPLFMNLQTKRVYRIPDNEELVAPELDDIRYAINPTYTAEAIEYLNRNAVEGVDLHGRSFVAGFIGINNIKLNSHANVCLHLLIHINPIRDILLTRDFTLCSSPLLRSLSEAARKVWNPRAFKALLSPHEFMQAVSIASERRYSLNKSADAIEFLAWLLNALDQAFVALFRDDIISHTLRGKIMVSEKKYDPLAPAPLGNVPFVNKTVPFLFLSLDLPPTPLYQSITGEYVIPQVSIEQLLEKYNGSHLTQRGNLLQAFSIEALPPYLILHYRRFTKAHLVMEKNRTLVMHPLTGLFPSSQSSQHPYDLITNICHHGEADLSKSHHYSVQLKNQASGRWYEIVDLHVKEIPAVSIPLCESYIQVWQRRDQHA